MNTRILDTTIRDGSYAVNFKYTCTDVRNIVSKVAKLGIDFIEIGHGMGLNASSPDRGESLYTDVEYIDAAKTTCASSLLGVFCIPGIARLTDIDVAQKHGIDFIRIGVTATDTCKAIPYIRRAKEIGLLVMVNFMKSYAISEELFSRSCIQVCQEGADYVYLVDSAGCMLPEDIERFYSAVKCDCPQAKLGFHGHNNLGLGVANALKCVDLGFEIVDCSFQGLGRSLGNVPTEQFVMATAKKYQSDIFGIDIPRLLEYGYVVLKDIIDGPLINPLELMCGYTGFHSSFLKEIYRCCRDFNVDPLRLIMAYSKIDIVGMDYNVLCQVAKGLPLDDFDDHPYNFRKYLNKY